MSGEDLYDLSLLLPVSNASHGAHPQVPMWKIGEFVTSSEVRAGGRRGPAAESRVSRLLV